MSIYKTTYHSRIERQDRIVFILSTVGFGEVVLEKPSRNNTLMRLTDTGVTLITSADGATIVTAYLTTMNQAKAITYELTGEKHISKVLYNAITKNMRQNLFEKCANAKY